MGLLDDPNSAPTIFGLLGAAGSVADSLEPSRLPKSPIAALLRGASGFGSGYLQGDQQMTQNALKEAQLAQVGARLGLMQQYGLLPPGFKIPGSMGGGAAPAGAATTAPQAAPDASAGNPFGTIGTGTSAAPGPMPTIGQMSAPAAAPAGAPQAGAAPPLNLPPGMGMRDLLGADLMFPGAGKDILAKQYSGPTQLAQLQQERDAIAKQNPSDPRLPSYNNAILKLQGIDPVMNYREGGGAATFNPATGRYESNFQAPKLPVGMTYNGATNTAIPVQGVAPQVEQLSRAEAGGKAAFEPMEVTDAQGNKYMVPRTALQQRSAAPPVASSPSPASGVAAAPNGAPAASPGLSSGISPRTEANLKEQGKGAGENFNTVRADADAAARTVDDIRTVRQIPADTGRLAPVQEMVGGYLESLGINSDFVRKAKDLQQFNAVASNYVLGKQLEQKGVQTEGDARRMRETFSSMTNIGEANDFILRTVEAQKLRLIDKQAFYEANANDPKVAAGWNKYIRETPIVAKGPNGVLFLNEYLESAKNQGVPEADALAAWRKRAR